MAKHTYTIASQEGVDRYGGEIGDMVELDVPYDEQKSVVAAGWLEPADEAKDNTKDDQKPKEASK